VTYLEQFGHQAVAEFCDQLRAGQNVPVRRQHQDEETTDGQGTQCRHLCVCGGKKKFDKAEFYLQQYING
jgi:hypothetical protein